MKSLIAVVMGLAAISSSAAGQMGPQVTFDHGYRYIIPMHSVSGCAIASGQGAVVCLWEGDGVRGVRQFSVGQNQDADAKVFFPELYTSECSVSSLDATGWKIAITASDGSAEALRVVNLPRTGAWSDDAWIDVLPLGSQRVVLPTIVNQGSLHLLTWIERRTGADPMRAVRVSDDLVVLDPEPFTIAADVNIAPFGVSASGDGGLIAWAGATGGVWVRALDASGLPSAAPVQIASWTPVGQAAVAVSRLETAALWLVTWADYSGLRFARVNAQGVIQSGGIGSVPGGCQQGLDTAPGPEGTLLVWREEQVPYRVRALMIADSGIPYGPTRTLDASSDAEFGETRRQLSCVWTGQRFAVEWLSYLNPPVLSGGPYDPVVEVWQQSLSAAGEPRFPAPLRLDMGSNPIACTPAWDGDGYRLISRDDYTNEFYHPVDVDPSGTEIAIAPRVNPGTPLSYPTAEATRWSGGSVMAYVLGDIGYNVLRVEHFDANGANVSDWGGQVDLLDTYVYRSIALAAAGDEALCAWTEDYFDGATATFVSLVRREVGVIREWRVVSLLPTEAPTVAIADGRYWVYWTELGSVAKTMRAELDPDLPGDVLSGVVAFPFESRAQRNPRLAVGGSQTLCAYTAVESDATDRSMRAVRLANSGEVLDGAPIVITDRDGGWDPEAIWSGENWFVAWMEYAPEAEVRRTMRYARVAADGVVLDPGSVHLADWPQECRLASAGAGDVLVMDQANSFRIFHESTSAVDPGITGVKSRASASVVWPNPSCEEVRMTLEAVVPTSWGVEVYNVLGQRIHSERTRVGTRVEWRWRPHERQVALSNSGVYWIRASTEAESFVRRAYLIR